MCIIYIYIYIHTYLYVYVYIYIYIYIYTPHYPGGTKRATSANMPLPRLQSSEGKVTTSREIEAVRRSFLQARKLHVCGGGTSGAFWDHAAAAGAEARSSTRRLKPLADAVPSARMYKRVGGGAKAPYPEGAETGHARLRVVRLRTVWPGRCTRARPAHSVENSGASLRAGATSPLTTRIGRGPSPSAAPASRRRASKRERGGDGKGGLAQRAHGDTRLEKLELIKLSSTRVSKRVIHPSDTRRSNQHPCHLPPRSRSPTLRSRSRSPRRISYHIMLYYNVS